MIIAFFDTDSSIDMRTLMLYYPRTQCRHYSDANHGYAASCSTFPHRGSICIKNGLMGDSVALPARSTFLYPDRESLSVFFFAYSLLVLCLYFTQKSYNPLQSDRNSSSLITCTPNSSALPNFEPASSPART